CLWFAGMQVDWAVVETSIGGRYDTTNVLPSKMAIINNIGLEHIPQLGRNLKEIAWHKAGIIKHGQPVIIAEQNTEIVEIFQAEAKLKNTKLYCQGKDFQFSQPEFEGLSICFDVKTPHGSVQNIRLNQPGLFQAQNAATAIMAANLISEKYKICISEDHIRTALEKWSIPGRMEIIQHLPTVILDIAHNPPKMQALVDSIKLFHPGKRITFILGMLSMKDVSSTIKVLLPVANKIFFAPVFVSGKLCVPVKQLAEIVGKIDSTIQTVQCENVKDAINRALVYSKKDDLIIITGSLYMVGEARNYWMPAEKLLAGAEETAGE
ncbi:MAG: Mur ligase family protein, partial [Chloroflexi bacterium]|nr:Mur ligase family protein [Chloroflexota bacterium]